MLFQNMVMLDVEGVEITPSEMSATVLNHLKGSGGFIQLPHDKQPINEYTDYTLFPSMFPTLFPFGMGSYQNLYQKEQISLENYARHLFALSDRQFQEHYSDFEYRTLLQSCFDGLRYSREQRQQCVFSLCLRV